MQNQVLEILIPNEPTGYKIVHLKGWEGKCFIVPRTELKNFSSRPEINHPGIYFLFGESDESTNQKLYIGEGEKFYNRLTDHDVKKDFWNLAIIFTGGIDKGDIKYLEFLATTTAEKINRYDITNIVTPAENTLSEFSLVAVKNYFNVIAYILNVLEYPVFSDITQEISSTEIYYLKSEGADAKSQLLKDGSLNVLAGSLARIKETESFTGWSLSARKSFIEDKTLIEVGDGLSYTLTRDVLFKSPSAAAATLTGRSINGWTAWKDLNGKTLDENLR